MKRILILEDNEQRIEQFRKNLVPNKISVTDQAKVAIDYLKKEDWDVLFLDHDLGGMVHVDIKDTNCGSAVAEWLFNNPERKPGLIIIHSWNTVGQQNMKGLLPESIIFPSAWATITSENLTDDNIKHLHKLAKQQDERMRI